MPPLNLGFVAHLKRQAIFSQDLSKRERTRATLIYSAAVTMEERGISPDLVARVCSLASVSRGTFYLYFPDAISIAMFVLKDFLRVASRWAASNSQGTDLYITMVGRLTFYQRLHAENAGLFRCLYVIKFDDPIDKRPYLLWQKIRHRWRVVLSDQIAEACGLTDAPKRVRLHLAYTILGMADDVFFQMHVTDNRFLTRTIESPADMVELLALMSYRAVMGKNPEGQQRQTATREAMMFLGVGGARQS
ncbi:MAG: TetR/AcrR family transcriptional regulator [Xanthobacteraceae bacterium]